MHCPWLLLAGRPAYITASVQCATAFVQHGLGGWSVLPDRSKKWVASVELCSVQSYGRDGLLVLLKGVLGDALLWETWECIA
jgi:hypothetical protein